MAVDTLPENNQQLSWQEFRNHTAEEVTLVAAVVTYATVQEADSVTVDVTCETNRVKSVCS